MEDITSKVKTIIVDKLGVDEADVQEAASFANDLGADSLDIVEMVMSLEEEFEIIINDESIHEFRTVGDVVAFIEDNI